MLDMLLMMSLPHATTRYIDMCASVYVIIT